MCGILLTHNARAEPPGGERRTKMTDSKEEKKWLDKFEARLRQRGLAPHEAIDIRNAVVDIDLQSDPAICADDELSYSVN